MAPPNLRNIFQHGRRGPLQAQGAVRELGQFLRQRREDNRPQKPPTRSQASEMTRVEWPVQTPYPAPDRWIVLPNVAALGPGLTSPGYPLNFSFGAGLVLGWNGCAANISDQELAASSLKVRIAWNGEEETVSNGTGADFVYFRNVFKPHIPYAPLFIRVSRDDRAAVYFQNTHPANTYTPDIAFAFWDFGRRRRRGAT